VTDHRPGAARQQRGQSLLPSPSTGWPRSHHPADPPSARPERGVVALDVDYQREKQPPLKRRSGRVTALPPA
jgi:hypothetical protein